MSVDSHPAQSNQDIYMAALEIAEAAERRAFLDLACGEDVERCRSIERLLAVGDPAADNPLDRVLQQLNPAPKTVQPAATQAAEADASVEFDISDHPTIDRYKLIKPGMDTRDIIARFEAER